MSEIELYQPGSELMDASNRPPSQEGVSDGAQSINDEYSGAAVHLRRADPTVDAIIRASFPDFTGQRVMARVQSSVRFWGTQWDEGCKREYQLVRLSDMMRVSVPEAPFMRASELHDSVHHIPDCVVCVVRVYGRVDYIEILSPACNIAGLLPPKDDLSDDEKTVLIATRTLKSSYGGVKDYRYSEARARTGITRERWEASKASLIGKRLLNRAGAITVEGRNAIGSKQWL